MPEGVGYGPQYTASTGLELNVVGDFAYAYNQSEMTNSEFTVLEFQTGNYLFVGLVEFIGPINFLTGNIDSGATGGISIALSGNVIAYLKSDTTQEDMAEASRYSIIIPPFTTVKIQSLNASNNTDYIQSTSMTGRIYK